MVRTVAIGIQDFEQIRKNNCFYVDKTDFIREVVGEYGCSDVDCPSTPFWKNLEYEHVGEVLLAELRDRADLF